MTGQAAARLPAPRPRAVPTTARCGWAAATSTASSCAPSITARPMTCWPPRWPRSPPGCAGSPRGGGGPGSPPPGGSVPARPGAGSPRPGWPPPGSATRPTRPALARLAHIRAVLAARLWLQAAPAWSQGHAWWHSERRLRAAAPVPARAGHLPDAEVHWPSLDASPYAGQVWAIEVELTPKPLPRTARIMGGLLTPAPVRAGDLPGRPGRPARAGPRRGRPAARPAVPDRDPGPAPVRVYPGRGRDDRHVLAAAHRLACGCSARPSKASGWLLLLALLVAVWPVTARHGRWATSPRRGGAGRRPGCAAPPPPP